MRTLIIWFLMLCISSSYAQVQPIDTLVIVNLPEVKVVSNTITPSVNLALYCQTLDANFLRKHFNGNFMQNIETIPGIHAMSIGSGFSKPMIRGMAFNRIAVINNRIKQEGQQWGTDHGLEVDAFDVSKINIIKGPQSLLYGSDAMGGTIEIVRPKIPDTNCVFTDFSVLSKSVNTTIAGSLGIKIKKNQNYVSVRYTESHFGDYSVPTDTIIYLTRKIPVYSNRLKNTAGYERDISTFFQRKGDKYLWETVISNVYQKTGFFPGAHGIPNIKKLNDDNNRFNIELPYSTVNHFKASLHGEKFAMNAVHSLDIGYQKNDRSEMSYFHTHYDGQTPPEKSPNKELGLGLQTFNGSFKSEINTSNAFQQNLIYDVQYQTNTISGYAFLMPKYNRFTTGIGWMATLAVSNQITLSGGIRYDYGKINTEAHYDPYLAKYLEGMNYDKETIQGYAWNAHELHKSFSDYSCALGSTFRLRNNQTITINLGRSFRLPGTNELAANGVHHGTFRHERGDGALHSEKGVQFDANYSIRKPIITVLASAFCNYFDNYIFLQPSGEWSVLPDASQIYNYKETNALFLGGELTLDISPNKWFNYHLAGEYVYTYNCKESIALPFSPQQSISQSVTFSASNFSTFIEWKLISDQKRVDRNEYPTSGAGIVDWGATWNPKIMGIHPEITFTVHNLTNKCYFNHLSFYRKIQIPEPGRNFQLLIHIPF